MQKIQLFRNNKPLQKHVLIDDEDFEKVNAFRWFLAGGRNGITYAYRKFKGPVRKTVYMHRFIMNFPEGLEIDHINGNSLDNRKHNLRICTHAQNCMNMSKRNHTYRYKGICLSNPNGKFYRAMVMYKRKAYYAGYSFKTQKEAALAYDRLAKKLFGEFAKLNFK